MRYIITGATSFLARAVIGRLKSEGHLVTALRHSFEGCEEGLPEKADIWLHFAWGGVGSVGRSDERVQLENIEMTMAALDKAFELGCSSFVFAGSQAEYGMAQNGSLKKEEGPVSPVSAYGRAKLEVLKRAQQRLGLLRANGLGGGPVMEYIHMRIFSVYGPGDHRGSLINSLIGAVSDGRIMELGSCTQSWDYLYIEDAARAIVLLCGSAVSGIYNVGSGDIRELRDYAISAAEAVRKGGSGLLRFGKRGNNAEGSADLSPDLGRIRALGFRPRIGFDEGMMRTAGDCMYRQQ